jgi:hypothetical protein
MNVHYGTCCLCNKQITKAGATRHLKQCMAAHETPGRRTAEFLHLRVDDFSAGLYWLDLAIKSGASLVSLDEFLRAIWLECCGHLSVFEIGSVHYLCDDYDDPNPYTGETWMDVPISRALAPAVTKFVYRYDFGTTTTLRLRVVRRYKAATEKEAVRLLARNEPPVWPCDVCGQPATKICPVCAYTDSPYFYCNKHTSKHRCEYGGFLPVVNSPRMGMCAYSG